MGDAPPQVLADPGAALDVPSEVRKLDDVDGFALEKCRGGSAAGSSDNSGAGGGRLSATSSVGSLSSSQGGAALQSSGELALSARKRGVVGETDSSGASVRCVDDTRRSGTAPFGVRMRGCDWLFSWSFAEALPRVGTGVRGRSLEPC